MKIVKRLKQCNLNATVFVILLRYLDLCQYNRLT